MLPSEIVILMAIAASKNSGKTLLTRPTDITGEYIGYLYNSLVTRGYLEKYGATAYRLTHTGRNTILEFLDKNGNRAEDVIKRLRPLGIYIGPEEEKEISRLQRQKIKVK